MPYTNNNRDFRHGRAPRTRLREQPPPAQRAVKPMNPSTSVPEVLRLGLTVSHHGPSHLRRYGLIVPVTVILFPYGDQDWVEKAGDSASKKGHSARFPRVPLPGRVHVNRP